MAGGSYQYGTSPRKIQPEYNPKKRQTKKKNPKQNKKQELSAIEKTNGQTEISIESSLNLKNLEKTAKKKLGMQKLDNDQKVYVTLPKKDYTESATPEVETEQSSNWLKDLFAKFFK